jgi:chromosome segregation ATPase
METGTAMTLVGLGAPAITGLIVSFVTWSLKRNVSHEDSWRQSTDNELRKLRERDAKRDIEISELRGELRGLGNALGELRGSIHQLAGSLESNREKQAEFYREELQKVEQVMRQELSRHIHPELPEKVAKLEVSVESLRQQQATSSRRKR